jgi:hypothetical protein
MFRLAFHHDIHSLQAKANWLATTIHGSVDFRVPAAAKTAESFAVCPFFAQAA